MTDQLDLTRLPRGQREWRSFVQAVSEIDDRAERYFLELKSEIDLNSKEHRVKVAKFILGAANRAPERAARRFEGYAVMLLGVARDRIIGVPPFEAKDLETNVLQFLGADGPAWDFERIDMDSSNDVIAIIVDPPVGGKIWTCLKDGPHGLRDGAIYIRADGETREAKGGEVRDLLGRATMHRPEVDLVVSIIGAVEGVTYSVDPLREYVDRISESLRTAASSGVRTSQFMIGYMYHEEERTPEQYEAQISQWREEVMESGPVLAARLAGRFLSRNALRVENLSKRFLEDVEIRVHLEGQVRAVDVLTDEDGDDMLVDLPKPPRRWGPYERSIYPGLAIPQVPRMTWANPSNHGIVSYRNGNSVDLEVSLSSLRPREVFVGDDDEFLLIADGASSEVSGHWTVTARGVHDVFEGEIKLPVSGRVELTDAFYRLLGPDDAD